MKTKHTFEKIVWDTVLQEWTVSLWDIVLRTIWLMIAAAAVIGGLKAMGWADTDMRGKAPEHQEVQP